MARRLPSGAVDDIAELDLAEVQRLLYDCRRGHRSALAHLQEAYETLKRAERLVEAQRQILIGPPRGGDPEPLTKGVIQTDPTPIIRGARPKPFGAAG